MPAHNYKTEKYLLYVADILVQTLHFPDLEMIDTGLFDVSDCLDFWEKPEISPTAIWHDQTFVISADNSVSV